MGTVILDGRHDDSSSIALDTLLQELGGRGEAVQTFSLRELRMGSCIGCFKCWLKTPGVCVEADEGREIAQAAIGSDTMILLSPVTLGGYTSEIKKAQDRWIPLILPDFGIYHGEVHHKPRYPRYPRWIGIGLQDQRNDEEAHIFRTLVGRNALNFHAPSFAADVILTTASNEVLHTQIRRILKRKDAFPLGKAITSLMPEVVTPSASAEDQQPRPKAQDAPSRALLLLGSPKIGTPSTSGVLGGYLMKQLAAQGWETNSLTLRRTLLTDSGQAELLSEANRADLILLAFPLYIDSLPFLMMKALEVMAAQHVGEVGRPPTGIVAIVNNGFPESYQNAPAVAICRRFASASGMNWLGGLAMGAGEALFSGQPFKQTNRQGPPVGYVQRALDLTASALADGRPIPAEAIRLIKKTPIPLVPFRLWRRFFIKVANDHWRRGAAQHEVGPEEMLAQPYITNLPPKLPR